MDSLHLKELEERLGYKFKNKELITEALTHKSSKSGKNNERLEFLGDAVLDLIVGEYLFDKFPSVDEGDLSKLRASLVNEKGFEKLAKCIKLGDYIFLSQAEENNNGRQKASILSNAFEAVIGAIYLESGLLVVQDIAIKLIEKNHEEISLDSLFKDFKTTLQEPHIIFKLDFFKISLPNSTLVPANLTTNGTDKLVSFAASTTP